MVLFVFPEFEYLTPYLKNSGLAAGIFSFARYPNQEFRLTLKNQVRGRKCWIIGSLAPPDSNILELTFLSHTLKKDGAAQVVAILPYLAYARQDKAVRGEGLGLQWVGQLLASSGIDQIVTIDLHSQTDIQVLPLPARSLSPAKLFSREVKELHSKDVTVVAPDEGALKRASEVASAAGIRQVTYLKKSRVDGITHLELIGDVKKTAVVIDDILDTGKTLISAIKELRYRGAKNFTVIVSHGLFTGQAWQQLWRLGVQKIYCLDTVPAVSTLTSLNIKVVSCGPLLAESFAQQKS